MTEQIDRDQLREGIANAEEDGCGVYSDPRDLTALLEALDQAEAMNIDEIRALAITTSHTGQTLLEAAEALYSVKLSQAEARIQAAREEHQQQPGQGPPYCTCDDPWPCATLRALDGES